MKSFIAQDGNLTGKMIAWYSCFEIKKLLNQWKVKRLTPKSRLIVLKTLIIAKCIHLALALPMSNDNFPKDFENEMFEFLWNSIIHKVKKTHQYLSGEFKMIDYREFITPLKYTWIRRMLHSKTK